MKQGAVGVNLLQV